MNIKLTFDVDKIAAQFKEFALSVEQDLIQSVAELAQLTKAKVETMAQADLHSSREEFLKALHYEDMGNGIHVVSIDESGLWVEEGIEPGKDMKPDLLKKGDISESTGNKYRIIPFDQNEKPSNSTPYAQSVIQRIRQGLKDSGSHFDENGVEKKGLPFKKLEFNKDGSPRIGKLHSLNFGGERPGMGNTPVMDRVSIYQSMGANGKVKRDIMTFRTVSSGPGSEGKWIHPGFTAKKYLDQASDWAMQEWENNILPKAMEKWGRITK